MDARRVHSLAEVGPIVLREKDRAECAMGGLTVVEALDGSIRGSDEAFAVSVNGALLCVWGYRRVFQRVADVWLLTTDEVPAHPVAFVRESRRLMNLLLTEFTILRVDVWDQYPAACRWLERLGFQSVGWAQPGFLHMIRTS